MTQYCKMAESSDAENAISLSDNYKVVHSIHGCYNTVYDDLNVPYCMTHAPPSNGIIS